MSAPAPQHSAVSHHYVPRWYQKRFIDAESRGKLFYLDLKPERVEHDDGTFHCRRDMRRLGPPSCFQADYLYTLKVSALHGGEDVLERLFFGERDRSRRIGCS